MFVVSFVSVLRNEQTLFWERVTKWRSWAIQINHESPQVIAVLYNPRGLYVYVTLQCVRLVFWTWINYPGTETQDPERLSNWAVSGEQQNQRMLVTVGGGGSSLSGGQAQYNFSSYHTIYDPKNRVLTVSDMIAIAPPEVTIGKPM